MKHTIEQVSPSRVKVAVAVEADAWKEAQEKAFKKVAAKVKVPGFRPGKAPRALVEKNINHEAVWNEAIDALLNPTFAAVLQETQLRPFFRPEVGVTKISDTELELVFQVITVPTATLGEYKGLEAPRPADSVTEEEVAAAVARRFESNAELVLVEREAKMGDTVTIDFDGFLPDEQGNLKPFDGGKAENYNLLLGSGSFIPGFEDSIVGMKAGQTKSFKVNFPENYVKELAGKHAQFQVKVHEVKEKVVPTADDAAVKELGIANVNTMDELKEFEKKAMLERKVRDSEERFYQAIVDKIVANATFALDEAIIANEAAQMEENLKKQVEQNGITFDQYCDITATKLEDLRANFMKQAEANLKVYVATNTVGEVEKLYVTDADVDAEVKAMAEQYKMEEEQVRGFINRDLDGFKNNLFQKKIHDFILSVSKPEGVAAKKAPAKKAAVTEGEEKPAAKKPAAKKPAAKKTAAKKEAE
ncbi:MAG: trigger factor [Bacilli bacterium]|nr:trigger factor [Bacilli bacterium]